MQQQLERIYQDHRQGLFTLALSITRHPDLAEDAVQEAFARWWQSKREPTGDPVAYVFASVRNAALQLLRGRQPVEAEQSIFADEGSDPAAAAIEDEQQRLVRRAVDALPIRQREAVVLRLNAGLTFQQIADTVGEPLQTIASRYRRALQQVKEMLEGAM